MNAKSLYPSLIATCCFASLVSYAIYKNSNDKKTAQALVMASHVPTEKKPVVPTDQLEELAPSSSSVPAQTTSSGTNLSQITAFHHWVEAAVNSGFAHANEAEGKQLAKVRGIGMKALIQSDPAEALRQALPMELYASLPPSFATLIEQPVSKTGMCSLRIMCNHAEDQPHSNCQETPVLLEEVDSWNAYYGDKKWRDLLGKTVRFDGIGIEGELAVQSIIPENQP